ncbi:latent-transforming growth factor beta-binding protein 2 isoform X1 [Electrophorus electricus]|uniref:latent-transforming growth factor beta-binding protein 2 isoform X1 n=1 Tax=Electrophorus electricus TaxID=8005 RepID=UPI0015D0B50A|nr:latent-transforming growth factor beta-binding protein 2 isoform X1 [Electrophorus electricus]
MDRLWILAFVSIAISVMQMCDGHLSYAGGQHEAATVRVVFEHLQARARSPRSTAGASRNGSSAKSLRSQRPLSSERLRSKTPELNTVTEVTTAATGSTLGNGDSREPRDRHGRSPRQLHRTLPSQRARSVTKKITSGHQENKSTNTKRLVGPHVCGGQQCCSGWAVAPGTNRCMKPDCQPPCQNRGSCSRPHTCVCRSGFHGAHCEEVSPEQVYIRTGISRVLTPIQPGTDSGQWQPVRRRPTERQAIDTNTRTQIPQPLPTRLPHSAVTQVRRGSPEISPQQTGASRTVKRYPSSTGPITSNALPSGHGWGNGQSREYAHSRHLSPTSGQWQDSHSNAVSPSGANLTAGVDRIKIVFTPMVCRRVCNGQRCYNSCEKGDKTTVYSETQGPPVKSQGFRLFFCQIPCMNGGRCIGQNECWCPSNSTGKFCHLPAPTPSKPTNSRKVISNRMQNGSSHTMYTLPLSNQQASMLPSLVNVHVQHPPEAKIQIHQVARVKPSQTVDGVHSVQQRSQPGNSHTRDSGSTNGISSEQYNSKNSNAPSLRPHNRLNGYVGRCFQETVDGQCGKPLPGLTKQDDCCGSVGASWGLNKCTECPSKPGETLKAYAVIANGQVECPKGYKRMNSTHCQDINECLMPGICKNAECLNTKGSYRCMCKPGYMLDPARSHCVSDKAVSVEKSMCYRSVSVGSCSLPLPLKITKQICCCSRVGKAWGSTCERCPLPDTDHFKEICPAGHGYTYSHSDVQITLRELEAEELQRVESFLSQVPTYHQPAPTLPETLHHLPPVPVSPKTPYIQAQVPTWPQLPKSPQPGQPPRTAQLPHPPQTVSQYPVHIFPSLPDSVESFSVPIFTDSPPSYPDVVEITTRSPTQLEPEPGNQDTAPINVATQITDIDKCSLTPTICGPGQCVSVQTGYTCYCDPGYKLNALQTTCIDINECEDDPCGGKGHCVNTFGSYTCQCFSGFSLILTQNRKSCQDINECAMANKCPSGVCKNTEGSFTCECKNGFSKNWRGQCEDVDECSSPSVCPSGKCVNTHGSYQCQACGAGFRPAGGRCLDINECQTVGMCANGQCVNTEGSFTCTCNHGYQTTPHNNSCHDVNECLLLDSCIHGTCINVPGSHRCSCNTGYQPSSDAKACEDVDECAEPSLCRAGVCVNTVGSFSCTQCEAGYTLSQDRQRCEDINECLSLYMCPNGICLNSEGSFSCYNCPTGYNVSADGELCEDIDECASPTTCPQGKCINTKGSYTCTICNTGYRLSDDGSHCKDIDECESPEVCPLAGCTNTAGSYSCMTCDYGYMLSSDRSTCEDIDECEDISACLNGECTNTAGSYHCGCRTGFELIGTECKDVNECLSMDMCGLGNCLNTEGSFLCICPVGFAQSHAEAGCQDVDECAEATTCSNGECMNTEGSYKCLCDSGYKFSTDSRDCEDLDECKEYSDACGAWNCENTLGSYRCFVGCQSGFYGEDNKDCDINECEDETICGKHGYCENTDGSYRCQCDQGYTNPPEGQGCIDINECERSTALCGEALCENVEGSFLCLCPSEDEEFDPITNQCRPRSINLPGITSVSTGPELSAARPAVFDEDQRKECYYNLNDANLCENVLSRNVTKQECCCTVGAGWGDDCEIHPCPQKGQVEYDWLCPHGSGILSVISSVQGFTQLQLQDADECEMFGSEICKNGHCLNLYSSYSCLCHDGYYYDSIRMECVDYDECKEENLCEHGTCVNTDGSFNCFCSPPLILDNTQRRCISVNSTEDVHVVDDGVHTHTCWKELKHDSTCSSPMIGIWTTYTECCCLYGVAWGSHCAFCPDKFTEDFAMLCNLPQRSSDSLRETPGFEYGPDASPDGLYVPTYWSNYGHWGGDTYYEGSEGPLNGPDFTGPSNNYGFKESVRVPVQRPRENQPPQRLDPYRNQNEGFEGLRAEECGILNGCENGRCVRVQEGYTCDCFDGYELDLSKMACVDINECEDISDKVELCKNGVCTNTDGSYKCTCLPGFVASSKADECIPKEEPSEPSVAEK